MLKRSTTISTLTILCAALTATLTAGSVHADSYLTLGGYHSKVDKPVDRAGNGGHIGVGYRLSDHWSVELGYEQFINQTAQWPNFGNNNNIMFKSGYKSAGFSATVVGKTAIDEQNTLFYRVGAINNKSNSWQFQHGNGACVDPDAETFTTDFMSNNVAVGTVRTCGKSGTTTGLLVGLGLDHHFSQQWFGRAEVVWLEDSDAESLHALKLALGYRF